MSTLIVCISWSFSESQSCIHLGYAHLALSKIGVLKLVFLFIGFFNFSIFGMVVA